VLRFPGGYPGTSSPCRRRPWASVPPRSQASPPHLGCATASGPTGTVVPALVPFGPRPWARLHRAATSDPGPCDEALEPRWTPDACMVPRQSPDPSARPGPTPTPAVELRPARKADAPALAELWALAFPGRRTARDRLRDLREGRDRFGGLETCWVGEAEGEMVGGLRSYPLRMALWGRDVPVQGLAAVAVVPSHRQRGIGAVLCRAALARGREEGMELSALFPFRTDFYRRLGFTLAGELHRYHLSAREFPRFPHGRQARVLAPEVAAEVIPPFYEGVRLRTQGLIRREKRLWDVLAGSRTRVVAVVGSDWDPRRSAGDIRGYMVVEAGGEEPRERATLRVHEAVAQDLEAHQALMGWLSVQRDQWGRVLYDALPGEHLERILGHPRRGGGRGARRGGLWFPSATLLRGPMLRILDLEALLRWARLPAGTSLAVRDPVLPENSGTWRGDGKGGVTRERTVSERGGGGGATGASGTAPHDKPAPAPGAVLPIGLVTELFLDGALPGQADAVEGWQPLLGIRDFRLLDTF
jgi:predicted acetyltransferase